LGTAAELGATSGVGEGAGVGVTRAWDDGGPDGVVDSPEGISMAEALKLGLLFAEAVQPTPKQMASTQAPNVRHTIDPFRLCCVLDLAA
jgi:hypothetical protein